MRRIAIIDLGTNTFNLLIAELYPDATYTVLFKDKVVSKLGEGGINQGVILPTPFLRGIEGLKTHRASINRFEVNQIYAFATNAIRSASNGLEFIDTARNETGIQIEIISGDREAELIYYGVRSAVQMDHKHSLIMDIGGGSTEFIIADKERIIWKHSFHLGAARLLEAFHESDPIAGREIAELTLHLQTELEPLFTAVKKYPVTELIGASGSFDSLAEMIAHRYHSIDILKNKTEYTFNLQDSQAIYHEILKSSRAERLKMDGLIEMRVDMIVVSAIFVHLVITHLHIPRMRLSTYSLKEGVLWDVLHHSLASSD